MVPDSRSSRSSVAHLLAAAPDAVENPSRSGSCLDNRPGRREGGLVPTRTTSSYSSTIGELRRDRRAFEVALDRWYPATLRLARSIVRNEQAAHDLVRDAWHSAVTRLPELDPGADLAALMLKETVQAAAFRLDLPTEQPAVPADRFEPESSRWAGWWTTTPQPLGSWGQQQRLVDALSNLAPAPAAVVALRDLEGLSASQVESVLGFPPDAQQALLHVARIAFWRALAGPEPEP